MLSWSSQKVSWEEFNFVYVTHYHIWQGCKEPLVVRCVSVSESLKYRVGGRHLRIDKTRYHRDQTQLSHFTQKKNLIKVQSAWRLYNCLIMRHGQIPRPSGQVFWWCPAPCPMAFPPLLLCSLKKVNKLFRYKEAAKSVKCSYLCVVLVCLCMHVLIWTDTCPIHHSFFPSFIRNFPISP